MVKRESNLIKTPNKEANEVKGLLCSIKFLKGVRTSICGGIVADGVIFCMIRVRECNTSSHARLKGFSEDLPGGKDVV